MTQAAIADARPGGALPLFTRFGWGFGSLGSVTVIYAQAFFLLYFFTAVLGLKPEVAGTLLLIAKGSDIVAGLVIGRLSDRLRSRWGRRKPFLLAGAVVAAIGSVLVFSPPAVSPVTQVLTLAVMGLGYCLFTVPYLAMPSEITASPRERTVLMSWRVVFVSAGELVAKSVFPLILASFGSGRPAYAALGWICAAAVGLPMLVTLALSPPSAAAPVIAGERQSIVKDIAAVMRNRGFAVLMLTKIPQSIGLTAGYASLLFFFTIVLGHTPAALAVWGLVSNVVAMSAIALWVRATPALGKKAIFFIGVVGYAAVCLSWLLARPGEALAFIALRAAVIGPFAAAILLMCQAILPDVIEDDRARTGAAREGAYASVYSLVEKTTAAIGPFIVGWIFHLLNFDPHASRLALSEGGARAVYVCVALIPATGYLLGLIPLSFYHLEPLVRRRPTALTAGPPMEVHAQP